MGRRVYKTYLTVLKSSVNSPPGLHTLLGFGRLASVKVYFFFFFFLTLEKRLLSVSVEMVWDGMGWDAMGWNEMR